jgi:hypothetical protein
LGFGYGAGGGFLFDGGSGFYRFCRGGSGSGGHWGLVLLVFSFTGFALSGAADLTGTHLMSSHDGSSSEMELARGEGLEAFARACWNIA